MPISIFKIFMVFGIVSTWAAKALENGKITLLEGADLAGQLGVALGIPTELEIPAPAAEIEEALPDTEEETAARTAEVPLKLRDFTK